MPRGKHRYTGAKARPRKGLGGRRIWVLPKGGPCAYCGADADTAEHLVPYRYILGANDRTEWLVPACRECNSVLGACEETSLGERAAELKRLMEVRYRKLLDRPRWTDSEIATAELEGELRRHVLTMRALRDFIESRLAYMQTVIEREAGDGT